MEARNVELLQLYWNNLGKNGSTGTEIRLEFVKEDNQLGSCILCSVEKSIRKKTKTIIYKTVVKSETT